MNSKTIKNWLKEEKLKLKNLRNLKKNKNKNI
jgi:hypothetical protein